MNTCETKVIGSDSWEVIRLAVVGPDLAGAGWKSTGELASAWGLDPKAAAGRLAGLARKGLVETCRVLAPTGAGRNDTRSYWRPVTPVASATRSELPRRRATAGRSGSSV
jgi:hypothetical protein